ncbi:MAG: IS66 family transposase zinc-finger binding domain-containing protein, partial [Succinivibrio sp.]
MITRQDIAADMSPEQMLEELARLRSENAALKQDNASLTQKKDELRDQRDTLSKQIAVLSADNDSLAARNLEAAADISKLVCELQKAHDEIDRLNELILVMKRELYGPKSERGGFNDAEEAAAEKEKPKKERNNKPRGAIDYSRFDQEVVDHTAPADKLPCPSCGTVREPIGYDVKWELKYIPGKMVAVQHRMWKYVC